MQTQELIKKYYAAFNSRDWQTFLSLLSEDVIHDVNQGKRETGKASFEEFMQAMDVYYQERIEDLVIMTNESGTRVAAEFTVHGKYLKTAAGLPEATGQTYTLPVGTFFEVRDNKITRVTVYYNLQDWLAQVK